MPSSKWLFILSVKNQYKNINNIKKFPPPFYINCCFFCLTIEKSFASCALVDRKEGNQWPTCRGNACDQPAVSWRSPGQLVPPPARTGAVRIPGQSSLALPPVEVALWPLEVFLWPLEVAVDAGCAWGKLRAGRLLDNAAETDPMSTNNHKSPNITVHNQEMNKIHSFLC